MPPSKPYGVAPDRNDRSRMHIVDQDGALCRLANALPAGIKLDGLTQYLFQAADEAVHRARSRRGAERLCSQCALSAGLDPDLI